MCIMDPNLLRQQIRYIPKSKRAEENQAGKHSMGIIKSQVDRFSRGLDEDFLKTIKANSTYLPHFLVAADDFSIFEQLEKEMKDNMVTWNRHAKHEDPTFSPTFNWVIERMADHFNVEVLATRLNYYRDGTEYKTFHKDSHAYSNGQKEDFTMGASFGASRELEFKHDGTGHVFSFPQHNGDIFAFTSVINNQFMHGVPKAQVPTGGRFSIIAWGRRRGSSDTI